MKTKTMTICDLCIKESVVFQRQRGNEYFCVLEQNVIGLYGKYRKLSSDDEQDYNFVCLYKSRRKTDGDRIKVE